LDPRFIVRDFGKGLCEEDVVTLFTTYFESTKDQRFDQIGAFGLGSKSPFAYTDSFNVTSLFEGKSMSFMLFKDEDGVPSIMKLSEEETDLSTGLEVSISIRQADFSEVAREYCQIASFFEVRPDIGDENFSYFDLENGKLFENEKVMFFHRRDAENRLRTFSYAFVYGQVMYRVDSNELSSFRFDSVYSLFRRNMEFTVIFKIPFNEISLTPSREKISFDKKTKAFLENFLPEVSFGIQKHFENEFNSTPNLFEKIKYLSSTKLDHRNSAFKVVVDQKLKFTITEIALGWDRKVRQNKWAFEEFLFRESEDSVPIFENEPGKSYARCLKHPDCDKYFFVDQANKTVFEEVTGISVVAFPKKKRQKRDVIVQPKRLRTNYSMNFGGDLGRFLRWGSFPPLIQETIDKNEETLTDISFTKIAVPVSMEDEIFFVHHITEKTKIHFEQDSYERKARRFDSRIRGILENLGHVPSSSKYRIIYYDKNAEGADLFAGYEHPFNDLDLADKKFLSNKNLKSFDTTEDHVESILSRLQYFFDRDLGYRTTWYKKSNLQNTEFVKLLEEAEPLIQNSKKIMSVLEISGDYCRMFNRKLEIKGEKFSEFFKDYPYLFSGSFHLREIFRSFFQDLGNGVLEEEQDNEAVQLIRMSEFARANGFK